MSFNMYICMYVCLLCRSEYLSLLLILFLRTVCSHLDTACPVLPLLWCILGSLLNTWATGLLMNNTILYHVHSFILHSAFSQTNKSYHRTAGSKTSGGGGIGAVCHWHLAVGIPYHCFLSGGHVWWFPITPQHPTPLPPKMDASCLWIWFTFLS